MWNKEFGNITLERSLFGKPKRLIKGRYAIYFKDILPYKNEILKAILTDNFRGLGYFNYHIKRKNYIKDSEFVRQYSDDRLVIHIGCQVIRISDLTDLFRYLKWII